MTDAEQFGSTGDAPILIFQSLLDKLRLKLMDCTVEGKVFIT